MVSCDDGHDEIHFEGLFRALCPLCKLRAELMAEVETAQKEVREAQENEGEELIAQELRADEAVAKLDKMEEDRDGWKTRAEELQAEIDKLKETK